MSVLQRIWRDYWLLSVFDKAITIVVGIGASAFMTRYLGVTHRGEYAYVVQISAIAALILNLGLGQSYGYFFRKYGGKVRDQMLSLFVAQCAMYCILAACLVAALPSNDTVLYTCILTPMAIVFSQMSAATTVEDFRLKIVVHILNGVAKLLVYGTLFLGVDVFGPKVLWAVATTAAIDLVMALIFVISGKRRPRLSALSWSFIREAIGFSWIPMINALLVTLNYSVDIVILRFLGSDLDLSLYAVAAGIVTYVWLVPDACRDVLVAKVARSDSLGSVNLSIRVATLAVLLVIAVFALVGKSVLFLLYGQEFTTAYLVTVVLLVGGVSMVFFKTIGVLVVAQGRPWVNFLVLCASVILNAIGNFMLIPIWGMYGSAIASVASYSLCGILMLVYYSRKERQSLRHILTPTRADAVRLVSVFRKGGVAQ